MRFLDELKQLKLPTDKFAIFGSGPMGVRGLKEVDDLDIIVKPGLWDELAKKYAPMEGKYIKIGNIEIFRNWQPWFDMIDTLIDTADYIDGYRYVKLEYVLKWKKMYNREKDRKDVEIIEKYLDKK